MIRSVGSLGAVAILLMAIASCSKHGSEELVVAIPQGFSGNFVLEMGVKTAPALEQRSDQYVVTVSKSGTVSTSTLLKNPKVTFRNSSDGAVWGYTHSTFSTGDGINVGGKIEFFVGTRKEFEAEEQRKNHSGKTPASQPLVLAARA
ncbi:MAG TPA: hypothetical protein VMH04_06870 [Candidatus Solibacter sp.]|nr:hypothetical protein [Candidatus Solibacter sp.]